MPWGLICHVCNQYKSIRVWLAPGPEEVAKMEYDELGKAIKPVCDECLAKMKGGASR